jgi:hypothetical protein
VATAKVHVHVALSRAELNAVGADEAGKLVIKTTLRVSNRAKILAPVDTGNMRASITQVIVRRRGEIIGRVGTDVHYAIYVHEGTRPHVIKARQAGALVFFWPKVGAVTVVPRHPKTRYTGYMKKGKVFHIGKGYVNHPGTKGRPFLRTALVEEATKSGFVVKRV